MAHNHTYNKDLLKGNPRYQTLHTRHIILEAELDELQTHTAVSLEDIRRLKKEKLSVLDQMQALQRQKQR